MDERTPATLGARLAAPRRATRCRHRGTQGAAPARIAALLTATLAVVLPAARGQGVPAAPLTTAAELSGTLDSGEERRHPLRPGQDGLLTLDASSDDFNLALRVERDGETLAANQDGGLLTDARLVLTVEADASYDVVVHSQTPRSGAYELRASRGDVPLPTGRAAEIAIAEKQQHYARWYLEEADKLPEQADAYGRAALQYLLAGGQLLWNLERIDSALRDLGRARALALELGDAPAARLAGLVLGACLQRDGSPQRAAELLEACWPAPGGDWQHLRLALLAMGATRLDLDELEAARQTYETLLEAARQRTEPELQALALRGLSRVAQQVGDSDAAHAHLARASDLLSGDGASTVAASLALERAQLALTFGRRAEAQDALRHAADRDPQDLLIAERLARTGDLAYRSGRLVEARDRYRQALDAARENRHGRMQRELRLGLALVLQELGALGDARDLLEQLIDDLGDERPGEAAAAWQNLTLVLQLLGDEQAADRAQVRALALAREHGGGPDLLEVIWNQHSSRLERGDLATLDARLLDLADDDDPAPGLAAHVVGLRARQTLDRDPAQALTLARDAADRADALGHAAATLADRRQHDRLALDARLLQASACLALGDMPRAAALVREARERLTADDHSLTADDRAARRAHNNELGQVEQDLAAARLAADPADAEAVAGGFEAAGRWKGRRLLEGLLARDPASGGGARSGPPGAALRAGLDDVRRELLGERADRALVEYVAGRDTLYAYIVTADDAELVPLGPRDALASAASDYAALLSRRDAEPSAVAAAGHALHGRLLAPVLARATQPPAELLVVPDASVGGLPFAALVRAAPDDTAGGFDALTFLGDDVLLSYGPSTPVLVAQARRRPRAAAGDVLVLADPLYEGLADTRTTSASPSAPLGRLHGTRDEALTLVGTWARRDGAGPPDAAPLATTRSLRTRVGRVDVALGADAALPAWDGDLRGYGWIHVGAHALVDPRDPRRTRVVLSPRDGAPADLTLAGVVDLVLDAELTVLSACSTARGRERPGEGVQSLATAFLQAGSRHVVASLWPVSDRGTVALMEPFYAAHIGDGLTPASALARAQHAVRRGATGPDDGTRRGRPLGGAVTPRATGVPPSEWAAFVAFGPLPR